MQLMLARAVQQHASGCQQPQAWLSMGRDPENGL